MMKPKMRKPLTFFFNIFQKSNIVLKYNLLENDLSVHVEWWIVNDSKTCHELSSNYYEVVVRLKKKLLK